jgi:hypothetical protein
MRIKFLVASLFLFSMVTSSYAQTSLRASIPFAFKVGDKQLSSGEYQFIWTANTQSIRVVSDKDSGIAIVLTRLAAGIHTTAKDAHVVFDKVGEQYWLAEMWIPGVDGFDLHNMTEKHEHRIIDMPVK